MTLTSNHTLEGGDPKLQLCYVNGTDSNYQSFLDECRRKNPDNSTVWILVSNVGESKDQNIQVLKNASNYTDSHVQALIMMSHYWPRSLEVQEDAEFKKFEEPKMLSIVTMEQASNFTKYAWNTQNGTNSTALDSLYIEYKHGYTNRCYLLTPLKPILLISGILNLTVLVLWYYYVFNRWKDRQYNIQKWMILFPLIKCISEFDLFLSFAMCPWDSDNVLMYFSQIL